jgi:DNA-binding NtrC family response regulator
VQRCLENFGYQVTALESGRAALVILEAARFDLLLSDLDLGQDIDGFALVAVAKDASSAVETIIMSGKASVKSAVPAHTAFIEKPVTADKLIAVLGMNTRP